jgi:hypothetical protein
LAAAAEHSKARGGHARAPVPGHYDSVGEHASSCVSWTTVETATRGGQEGDGGGNSVLSATNHTTSEPSHAGARHRASAAASAVPSALAAEVP